MTDVVFVDRENEIETILMHLESAKKGEGRILLLGGEAGIGKTSLMEEVKRMLAEDEVIVAEGRCVLGGGAVPYAPFTEIIDVIGEKHTPMPIREEKIGGAPLGLLGVSSAGAEGGIALLGMGEDEERKARMEDLSRERGQVFGEIVSYIRNASQTTPLMLIIEDMQWIDESSAQLLIHISHEIGEMRCLIIGAYRVEEVEENSPAYKLIESLSSARSVYLMELKGLSKEDVKKLIEEMTGIEAPPENFVEIMYRRSGGNPTFVKEALRALLEDGLARTPWDVEALERLAMPKTVREVIGRKIKKLPNACIKVLKYASIVGEDVDYEVLRRIVNMDEDDLLDALDTLLEEGILAESEAEDDEDVYVFTNFQTRAVIYNGISRSRRRITHRKIGEVMENLYSSDMEKWVYHIARHFYMGRDYEKALKYSIAAARRAKSVYAIEDAIQYYKWALRSMEKLGRKGEDMLTVLLELGNMYSMTARWEEAIPYYTRVIEGAMEGYPRYEAIARIRLGDTYRQMSMWEKAEENLDKGLEISERINDKSLMAEAERMLGYIHWRKGEYKDAVEHYMRSIGYAKEAKDEHVIGVNYIDLGNVYSDLGDDEKAIRYYNMSLEILEKFKDYAQIARAYNNLGDKAMKRGDWERAVEYFKKCEETAKKIGSMDMIAWAEFNTAEALARWGRLDDALKHCRRSIDILSRIGDTLGLGAAHRNMGLIYRYMKKWESAEDNFEKAVKILRDIGSPYIYADTLYEYSLLYLDTERHDKAFELAREAKKIFESLGATDYVRKIEDIIKDAKGCSNKQQSRVTGA
ncbi:MAG: hypothetical protein DRN20_05295 [Thermoplasmata archaeon]|nr:MAG: hypothetical protein DRN20_05295 [Thermoplasmata archaeon]